MNKEVEIYRGKIEEKLKELSKMLEKVEYVDEKELVGTIGALADYMRASKLFKETASSQIDEIARRIHQYFVTKDYSNLEETLKDLKKLIPQLEKELKEKYKNDKKLLILLSILVSFFFIGAIHSITSKASFLSFSLISFTFSPIVLLVLVKLLRKRK